MKIDIITCLPELLSSYIDGSMLKIGRDKGLLDIRVHCLRDWATDKRRTTDDSPYGGGPGMIMMIGPIVRALKDLRTDDTVVIYPAPEGKIYDQQTARELSKMKHLIFICGHYKGIDARINHFVDRTISLGDYILTGGELPAAIISDSVCRLIPGVMSDIGSADTDSFENGLLDCDYFTKPAVFEGLNVPEILCGGNHKAIDKWRMNNSIEKTKVKRPDLYEKYNKIK
ncbi:MAG TPA: tRNA (guanosine(37)-N1)-methyltransferase TrmD [Clostridiales bacterium]|jgi:tRNA (guanine37-N1)-methyltransferase|nr:tRNA (guanosine(37)-N1)-methyltransferase TrmD [Clostridiales bacterium]HQP70065.1 tRNA (guanosine(37)-N1)-methyltransferase TrmD [Clostridiales bacterium]